MKTFVSRYACRLDFTSRKNSDSVSGEIGTICESECNEIGVSVSLTGPLRTPRPFEERLAFDRESKNAQFSQ